jgi:caffeoyl-CoA O-methyltransferase
MEFLPEALQAYCDLHTDEEPEALKKINRETHLKVLKPRMLSGHFQGRFLSFLSKISRPKNILEIGTYTGYSAICLAEGLQEDGLLVTVDCNEELEQVVKQNIALAGLEKTIVFKLGDAKQMVSELEYQWDMVFIDADKVNYSIYYDLVFDKVNMGGLIIADNVLWSGKVLDSNVKPSDEDTKAILAFNYKVAKDPRVERILLPLRDGLMVARKIKNL